MGTNYFFRFNDCRTCTRFDEAHVGKSGNTWQAYDHKLMDEKHPEWGYEVRSPFGFPIRNLADWRRVFTEVPGELWNEYGEEIDDPVKWLDEQKPFDMNRDWAREWVEDDIREGRGWMDDKGYRFIKGDFG